MDTKGLKMAQPAAPSAPKTLLPGAKPPAAAAKPATARPFARKVKKEAKENLFVRLRNSSGFTIMLGLLITAVGVICFIPWHNQFSKIMLDLGLITSFFGFFMKVLDILIKIITER